MYKNPYLRKQQETLQKRRLELGKEKADLQKSIVDSGITSNARRFVNPDKIDGEKLRAVNVWIKRLAEIDKEIFALKDQLREISVQQNSEQNLVLITIMKEIFTESQLAEIYAEAKRRLDGETPFKISYDWKNLGEYKAKAENYRKLAREHIDAMLSIRVLLTDIISKGCAKYGNAEFLQLMSPINRLILPVGELEKTKRKHLL